MPYTIELMHTHLLPEQEKQERQRKKAKAAAKTKLSFGMDDEEEEQEDEVSGLPLKYSPLKLSVAFTMHVCTELGNAHKQFVSPGRMAAMQRRGLRRPQRTA